MKTSKRGISLIVLVITIIVMIILAAAIILSLNGSGILSKAEQAKESTNNAQITEGIQFAYLTAMTQGKGKVTESLLQEALNEQFGSEKATNSITMSGEEIKSVTIDGVSVEFGQAEKAKQWTLPENDTEINVGDLLTPTVEGLENEKFYVIAKNGTTLTLLAERCINTSTNRQDSSYSLPAFDENSNVYNESDIQGLVNAYVRTLIGLDLEDVEVAYGADPETGIKGRLLWFEEVDSLKDTYNDMICGPEDGRVNYWTGSPYSFDDYVYIWAGAAGGSAFEEPGKEGSVGLRPVMKIDSESVAGV